MDSNSTPFFSVIIPVFNREQLIIPAIECVINQIFTSWELLIIDDASTDNTIEVVKKYSGVDNRIKLIEHKTNKERGAARNTGIKNSKGKYICFLDSDDKFIKHHLQTFYDYIKNNGEPKTLLFTSTYIENKFGVKVKKKVPYYSNKNKFAYILQYTFNPTRVCVHSSILKKIKFDETIPGLEDIDLWLRIATKHKIIQLDEYTSIYLVHDDSYTSGDPLRYQKELKNFETIFSKPELIKVLPSKGKNRLLSMCNFHLAIGFERENQVVKMYKALINSFLLFSRGYNGKTNKIMAVMFFYHIPIVGNILKSFIRLVKNQP